MKLEDDSWSQAGQESFVLEVVDRKRMGFYLEIGGYHSRELSNTFLLESRYGWKGVSLEINCDRVKEYRNNRMNPIVWGADE